jgi:hypothetical protein
MNKGAKKIFLLTLLCLVLYPNVFYLPEMFPNKKPSAKKAVKNRIRSLHSPPHGVPFVPIHKFHLIALHPRRSVFLHGLPSMRRFRALASTCMSIML